MTASSRVAPLPTDWLPDMGTRWVHVWIEPCPGKDYVLVCFAYENVRVDSYASEPLVMPAHAARTLIDRLRTPAAVWHDAQRISVNVG